MTYSSDHIFYLKFSSPCTDFQFLDRVMEVSIMLCDDTGRVVYGRDVPFDIYLQFSDEPGQYIDQGILIENPEKQVINGMTGKSPVLRLQMINPSSNHRDFMLTVLPQKNQLQHMSVVPVSSTPFRVVRHRLEIYNDNDIPGTWFRDEGGKGNQIQANVRLLNSKNEIVKSRVGLRLKCVLLFEDGEAVSDQSFLDISNDTIMFLNASTGEAKIKFRLKQVSLKHDSRRFKVMIAPDLHHNLNNSDVSHDITPPIEVKSKVSKENKLKRQRKQFEEEQQSLSNTENTEQGMNGINRSHSVKKGGGNMSPSNSIMGYLGNVNFDIFASRDFSDMAYEKLKELHQVMSGKASPTAKNAYATFILDNLFAYHQHLGLSPSNELLKKTANIPAATNIIEDSEEEREGSHHHIVDDAMDWVHSIADVGPNSARESSLFSPDIPYVAFK